MRIAVTYENGEIFQHFGHTEQFKVYEVADGKVTNSMVLPTNGSGTLRQDEVLHFYLRFLEISVCRIVSCHIGGTRRIRPWR